MEGMTSSEIHSSQPASSEHPAPVAPVDLGPDDDHVDVEFLPEAAKKFNELFDYDARQRLLWLLVHTADGAEVIKNFTSFSYRRATIFGTTFRYLDMRQQRLMVVESLETDNEDPPSGGGKPTNRLTEAAVSGGISGLIRWALDEVQKHLFRTQDALVELSPQQRGDLRTPVAHQSRAEFGAIGIGAAAHVQVFVGEFGIHLPRLLAWRVGMLVKNSRRSSATGNAGLGASVDQATEEVVTKYRVPIDRSVDVRAIRKSLGMTQEVFAETFGLSLASLRNWEQGSRVPERPIALYLRLIEKYPTEVRNEIEQMRLASSSDA